MIDRLIEWIERCSLVGGYASGFFMVLIVILISVEILARTLFGTSTLIADEYSAYFFVAVVLLGLAFALKDGAHIRITLVQTRLTENGRRILDLAVTLIALVLALYAFRHAVEMVYDTWSLEMTADSISETPIWIPQVVIPVGLLLFILQLAAHFLRRLSSSQIR